MHILDVRGNRVPISVSTAVFRDFAGQVSGGVETFRDLSVVEGLRKLAYPVVYLDGTLTSQTSRPT